MLEITYPRCLKPKIQRLDIGTVIVLLSFSDYANRYILTVVRYNFV